MQTAGGEQMWFSRKQGCGQSDSKGILSSLIWISY